MKKSDRQKVFNKYGGRCAYCGCELMNGWHVDHLEPVNRLMKRVEGFYRHKQTRQKIDRKNLPDSWWLEYEYVNPKQVFHKMEFPERDTYENSMPSCGSCNNYKHSMSLESFRREVGCLVGRLNKSFTQYKIAKRYGLIQETGIEVKFYFETANSEQNPELSVATEAK